MRILSGQYRGYTLCSFSKSLGVRPMTQRVKKSVFDILRPILNQNKHIRVLDLFSGSGSLSFEALSQGAAECCAVEMNPSCVKMIQKNAFKLKVQSQLTLCQKDVFLFLKKYQQNPFDVIFCDPPFQKMYTNSLIKALNLSSVCDRNSWIILETSSKEMISEDVPLLIYKKKHFGDKIVYLFHIHK